MIIDRCVYLTFCISKASQCGGCGAAGCDSGDNRSQRRNVHAYHLSLLLRRLHVRVPDAGQLRFVTCWDPGVAPYRESSTCASSRRRPSAARKMGPSARSPTARSIARAVRGASGIVTTLPPFVAIRAGRRWRSSAPSRFPGERSAMTSSELPPVDGGVPGAHVPLDVAAAQPWVSSWTWRWHFSMSGRAPHRYHDQQDAAD